MAEKKGVIEKIADDLAESTRNVHQINKENFAAVKADTRANFKEATEPNPDFVRLQEAEGFKNKVKVIAENIKVGAAEKEKAHRAEVQSHESYRKDLEKQKIHRQATIRGNR